MARIEDLNIYLAQIDVVAGAPSKNLATIEETIDCARAAGADLVVFPEMCVGGYFLADKWTDDDWVAYLESFNERIREASSGIGVIWGNVGSSYRRPAHPGHDGRRVRYNMAFFAADGAWVARAGGVACPGCYIKALQPNYRVFDDDRYFCSALDDAAYYDEGSLGEAYLAPFEFTVRGATYRVGIEVCEDLWSGDYAIDPTAHYARSGCDFIVNISASPWTRGKDRGRDKRVAEHVRNLGEIPPLVYVNAVGMQNASKNVMAFDGGSTVYGRDGGRVFGLNDEFRQECAPVDFAGRDDAGSGADADAAGDARETEKLFYALTSTLRRFDEQVFSWKPTWVIGLSGGIDSSVTLALLWHALGGPERIVGYNLATRYNSDATKANAASLADAFGIRLVNGSIEALVEATDSTLAQYGYDAQSASSLVRENVQARLRGHMLSTFAQIEGGVVMNNGNKVETLLGYATLYGDAIGAISPLGDVTKAQLFELARYINDIHGREMIAKGLVPEQTPEGLSWACPPSAELADGQFDPMKWFYHDWLVGQLCDYPGFGAERVMEAYAHDRLQSSPVAFWVRYYGLDEDPRAFVEDLEWVLRQMRVNVFKRIQGPPNIMVSRGAFGMDLRECQCAFEQTQSYRRLRAAILAGS